MSDRWAGIRGSGGSLGILVLTESFVKQVQAGVRSARTCHASRVTKEIHNDRQGECRRLRGAMVTTRERRQGFVPRVFPTHVASGDVGLLKPPSCAKKGHGASAGFGGQRRLIAAGREGQHGCQDTTRKGSLCQNGYGGQRCNGGMGRAKASGNGKRDMYEVRIVKHVPD